MAGLTSGRGALRLDSSEPAFYRRTPILPASGAAELDKHLLLCLTGQRHRPSRMWEQVRTLKGREVKRWMEVSHHTENFAMALSQSDWRSAAQHLNEECDVRMALDPGCLSKRAKLLVNAGRHSGLGCRYAGHGHGGCVWAIGEEDRVAIMEKAWRQIARNWKDAWVIRPKVAPGLIYCE